ncbi:MAG TPA: HD domain-containing protein [Bacteroidales bacterium]|nr:HD domain-containing protein [Bacteroidales bacterium]HPT22380.1 HD domain-containing protein [Bacteroidales bacterium]
MNRDREIKMTEEFVRRNMEGHDSGHDWSHVDRVRNLALIINREEPCADPFILEIAALLHDSADSKFAGGKIEDGYAKIEEFIDAAGMDEIKEQVMNVVKNVSFSKKDPSGNLNDPVLLIVQDADRLDAIGAIGVSRAFNYGGFMNNAIYTPEDNTNPLSQSTIKHFYDKLLKLKDMMNTPTGLKIAEERHLFMEIFLEQFRKEWDFDYNQQ